MVTQGTVHIVDDDPAILDALTTSLQLRGLSVANYDCAESFLSKYQEGQYGCLVLDIRMPGINGLELQQILHKKTTNLPIIFVTGHGDIPMSVKALKNGAIDFLEKPYRQDVLYERIEEALALSKNRHLEKEIEQEIKHRFRALTPREIQVMDLLTSGSADKSNKEIANALNISPRTVEDHRAKLMRKMDAHSLPELVEMTRICGMHKSNFVT